MSEQTVPIPSDAGPWPADAAEPGSADGSNPASNPPAGAADNDDDERVAEAGEAFRQAFDQAPIGIALTSTDGRFLQVNRALCQITGYGADDLIARPERDITHPDDAPEHMMALWRLASGQTNTVRSRKRYRRPDGSDVWVSVTASAARDAHLRPLYFVTHVQDIDSDQTVSQALRQSEERFRSVTESVNDAIVSADGESRIVFWNEAAREMFGYTAEEAYGRPLEMIMPERYREAHRRGLARLHATGKPKLIGGTVELEGLRRDGTEFPLELSLGAVWKQDDQAFYTGVLRDTTERERGRRYLQAQLAVSSVLADNPPLDETLPALLAGVGELLGWEAGGFWLPDAAGEVMACAAFWSADEEASRPFADQSLALRLPRGTGLAGRVWASGEPVWVPDALVDPNFPRAAAAGEAGLRGAVALPIVADGEVVGAMDFFSARMRAPEESLLEMMSTISAQVGQYLTRRRAQDDLATANTELEARATALERSNAELAQFAYVASHDLSEPLRQVSGFVQLLAQRYRGQLDSDADEFIAFTVDGVERMQGLIEDLLSYSRVGRSGREDGPVSSDRACRRALDALGATVAERGAEVEIVGELPMVLGVSGELGQVFQNLLSNALKFCEGAPRVRVAAEARGDWWRFTVDDNGIGIEPRHAERIFKMFQRLHARGEYPGTGIGLAICKKTVERNGGTLAVEPSELGGSRFVFSLPVAPSTEPTPEGSP